MSTFDKIKVKILSTPAANDFTPTEIQHFLEKYGFVCVRSKGSHFIYKYPSNDIVSNLVIPMHNPIKPAYIEQIEGDEK